LLTLLFADIVRGWYFELAVCQKCLFAWLSFEWNVAQQDADVILCYIIFRIEVKPEVKLKYHIDGLTSGTSTSSFQANCCKRFATCPQQTETRKWTRYLFHAQMC
jgi:hypothetical protein